MSEEKTFVKKMNKQETIDFLTKHNVPFDATLNAKELKEIALAYEHLEDVKGALTAREVSFTPENTIEELEAMLQEDNIAHFKEELSARNIEFTEENTWEELEKLLDDAIEAEKASQDSSESESKIPEGFVQIRNEKNRVINGLRPWRITLIKEENLAFYLSHGCSVYTGTPSVEETKEEAKEGEGELAPHLR